MKTLFLILALMFGLFVQAQEKCNVYRLVFDTEEIALDLMSQLQQSEENPNGYKALGIDGFGSQTIKAAYTDEDGIEHEAEIDERYFALVMIKELVPELNQYITTVPYFKARYSGMKEEWVVNE